MYCTSRAHPYQAISLHTVGGKQVLYILTTPITSYLLRTVRYHPSHSLWTISSCQVSSFPSVSIPSHPMPIPLILHPTTVLLFPPLPSYRQSTHHPPCPTTPVNNSPIPKFPTPQPRSPHHPNLPVAEFLCLYPPHPALHLLLSFLSSSPTTNLLPSIQTGFFDFGRPFFTEHLSAFVFSNPTLAF